MKRTFICLVILFFAAVPAAARRVELTLHPAKAVKAAKKYILLPVPGPGGGWDSSDALLLYQKAAQSLPKNLKTDKIHQWLKTPLNKLPHKQVQSTLQQLKKPIRLVIQAGWCKQCQWPTLKAGETDKNLSKYREIARILALQSRLQIAQGQYNQAIGTMQTGLLMAKNISKGPTLTQGLVGTAIAALMLNQVEELIQAPGAPDLYWALQKVPKPLIDLNKQMELEIANIESNRQYNVMVRTIMKRQLKPAHERVRFMMNRLDRHVATLQCIEALRLYAAAHKGKFPNALTEITRIPIPDDPVTQKPFVYSRTGSKAVLEAPAPKGAKPKDAMRYQLTLKE